MKIATFLIPLVLAGGAMAQEENLGEVLYMENCSTCHGVNAHGDGPLSDVLLVAVPNLTTLAKANDGEFPLLKVIQTIDGRGGVRGHGGPMPIYGGLFLRELEPLIGRYGSEAVIRGRTLAIAEYLLTMQE